MCLICIFLIIVFMYEDYLFVFVFCLCKKRGLVGEKKERKRNNWDVLK